MRDIHLDSGYVKDHHQAGVLVGRTIVAVDFPQEPNWRFQHLLLTLDDGSVVDVSGQGYETRAVDVRIEVPE